MSVKRTVEKLESFLRVESGLRGRRIWVAFSRVRIWVLGRNMCYLGVGVAESL